MPISQITEEDFNGQLWNIESNKIEKLVHTSGGFSIQHLKREVALYSLSSTAAQYFHALFDKRFNTLSPVLSGLGTII